MRRRDGAVGFGAGGNVCGDRGGGAIGGRGGDDFVLHEHAALPKGGGFVRSDCDRVGPLGAIVTRRNRSFARDSGRATAAAGDSTRSVRFEKGTLLYTNSSDRVQVRLKVTQGGTTRIEDTALFIRQPRMTAAPEADTDGSEQPAG